MEPQPTQNFGSSSSQKSSSPAPQHCLLLFLCAFFNPQWKTEFLCHDGRSLHHQLPPPPVTTQHGKFGTYFAQCLFPTVVSSPFLTVYYNGQCSEGDITVDKQREFTVGRRHSWQTRRHSWPMRRQSWQTRRHRCPMRRHSWQTRRHWWPMRRYSWQTRRQSWQMRRYSWPMRRHSWPMWRHSLANETSQMAKEMSQLTNETSELANETSQFSKQNVACDVRVGKRLRQRTRPDWMSFRDPAAANMLNQKIYWAQGRGANTARNIYNQKVV